MAKSALSLRDGIERGSDVWFDPEFSQERKTTIKWAVEGYHGEPPDMVLRVIDELRCLKQDVHYLIWLLDLVGLPCASRDQVLDRFAGWHAPDARIRINDIRPAQTG